jgi:hypothetical protein
VKPFPTPLSIVLLSTAVEGAVAEGENLLINGGLDAECGHPRGTRGRQRPR